MDAEQRRAQRRDELLAAALQLFADKGYMHVSIEEICQTAYVGTKSFYELFNGKEACYLALYEKVATTLKARMEDALRAVEGTGREGMERLVVAFARTLVGDPRVLKIAFRQASSISAAVDRNVRANRRWAAAFLDTAWRRYRVVDSCRHDGREVDVHAVALGVIGGTFDLITDWLHEHDSRRKEDVEVLIAKLVAFNRITCDGLAAASVHQPAATA